MRVIDRHLLVRAIADMDDRDCSQSTYWGLILQPNGQEHESGYETMNVFGITHWNQDKFAVECISTNCDVLEIEDHDLLLADAPKVDIVDGLTHVFFRYRFCSAWGTSTVSMYPKGSKHS